MIRPMGIDVSGFTDSDREKFRSMWTEVNGCWEWNGKRNHGGYGSFTSGGKWHQAHRLALALAGVDIDGRLVCHKCDNPSCVNPDHLFLGTHKDNHSDMMAKGRSNPERRTVIPEKTVSAIRMMRSMGSTVREISEWTKVSESHIDRILKKKRGRGDYHARPVRVSECRCER